MTFQESIYKSEKPEITVDKTDTSIVVRTIFPS